MLYLAEVKKQSKGLLGGSETKLKLLACQRNDQSWSAIPGDDLIPCDEANSFGDSTLVMVNLGNNRQLQGAPELASGRLVSLLQNFTRILDKTKDQEEEIEQWKQSLTFQSQELNRREMEMEARLEQVEQLEGELANLEAQRREVEALRQESDRVKQEFDRKQQELQTAWEHLRGEQARLEKDKDENKGLSQEQVQQVRNFIPTLNPQLFFNDGLRQQIVGLRLNLLAQQQQITPLWEQLKEEAQTLQQRKGELEQDTQALQKRQETLLSTRLTLAKEKGALEQEQRVLSQQEASLNLVLSGLKGKEELKDLIDRLGIESGEVRPEQKIDLSVLENMALGELENTVQNLKADLDKLIGFVNDQEMELNYQQQTIDEVKAKIQTASEYDRLNLEADLANEQDQYQMLEESLVGSRRNLREREEIYKQHYRVLKRRQGHIDMTNEEGINLEPLIAEIIQQKQTLDNERQRLEQEIAHSRQRLEQLQGELTHKEQDQDNQQLAFQADERVWQSEQAKIAYDEGRISLLQSLLQPLYDKITQAVDEVTGLEENLNTVEHQSQNLGHIQQVLLELIKQ